MMLKSHNLFLITKITHNRRKGDIVMFYNLLLSNLRQTFVAFKKHFNIFIIKQLPSVIITKKKQKTTGIV